MTLDRRDLAALLLLAVRREDLPRPGRSFGVTDDLPQDNGEAAARLEGHVLQCAGPVARARDGDQARHDAEVKEDSTRAQT